MLFPDLGEKATQETLHEIKEVISSFDGKIFHEDVWGIRELAYTIRKQDEAYYIVWNMDFPGEKISEFEKMLNIHQAVMRYMMTKTAASHQIKTLKEYELEKEAAEQEAKEKAEEAEKEKNKRHPAPTERPKPKPMEARPVKKAEPVKEEAKEEKKAEKEEPKATTPKAKPEAKNLEDVDAKLKSIIDDPDISL